MVNCISITRYKIIGEKLLKSRSKQFRYLLWKKINGKKIIFYLAKFFFQIYLKLKKTIQTKK